jgi:hypothetical protein
VFNQIENFRTAILKKKARIEEINFVCSQPMRPGVNPGSRRRLIEKRLHLEQAVAELETEIHRMQFRQANDSFRLDQIDQALLTAKTHNLSEESSRRIAKAKQRIQFECAQNGNSASFTLRWFDFMEKEAEERVEKIYAAYRETWLQQNRVITPSFIRAVRDRAIAETLAAIKSSVAHGELMRACRQGRPPKSMAIAEWMRRMDRLTVRVKRKLEAEALVVQHAGLRSRPDEPTSFDLENASTLVPNGASEPEILENFRENEEDLVQREAIVKKVENPQAYKVLLIREAAMYFSVQPRTIYRWLMDGKLRDGGRSGSVTTESVRQWETKRRRKRRAQ